MERLIGSVVACDGNWFSVLSFCLFADGGNVCSVVLFGKFGDLFWNESNCAKQFERALAITNRESGALSLRRLITLWG